MRLVSMLPSATEIVYALGLGEQLVGVSFECDEPASARVDKTVIVSGRDTRALSAAEIDEYVRSRLAAGEDLYTLHEDALAGLDPDVILTQDLCRVCALPSGQVEKALDYLGCQADVVSLDPHSLDEVLESIVTVGAHTEVIDRARAVVAGLRRRLVNIAGQVEGRPRPRVAVVEWTDPLFLAGHWVPDLVTAAGGTPVAARPHARSVRSDWSEIVDARPDLVLVAPCGFHLDGASGQAVAVSARVPGVAVWAIDADGLVVRPGPRLVDGVEAIASILHPDAVPPPARNTVARIA